MRESYKLPEAWETWLQGQLKDVWATISQARLAIDEAFSQIVDETQTADTRLDQHRRAVISRIEDHFLAIDLETIESLSRQLDHRSDCYFTLGGGLVEQLLAEGEAAFSALDRGMRVSNEITSNEDAMEFYDGVESAYTDATAVDDDFEESDDFEDYATRVDEQRYEDQFSAGVEFAEHFSRQHDRNSMLEMAGEVSPHQYFLDGVRYVIDTASQN